MNTNVNIIACIFNYDKGTNMDDNINQAFVIGTFKNAYLTEAERLANGQYKIA